MDTQLHALVVDDEVMVRNLTMRALAREGFQCDAAADGQEALALAACNHYDAVVTDLKMPNMHGHALAVELLARHPQPLVFVLTAVTEPRLAKDLLHRGVTDVLFKPIEYPLLAAKIKSRVSADLQDAATSAATVPVAGLTRVDAAHYAQQRTRLREIIPASEAALNVYRMTNSAEFDAQHLGREIAKHDVLAAEVIELANSSFYNPSRTRIDQLDRAVTQMGQKRIGQLALAANVQASLLAGAPDWLELGSLWRRSVAAGLAIELLIALGGHQEISEGLLLCATVHELGHAVLASIYPDHYEQLLATCRESGQSLRELEHATLPQTQCRAMCEILASWGTPPHLFTPLQHLEDDPRTLARLGEPIRTQVELLKLAGLIAKVAIGAWEVWDHIELPAADVWERLRLFSIRSVVQETRRNVEGINCFNVQAGPSCRPTSHEATHALAYYTANQGPIDFLSDVVASMQIRLTPCANPAAVSQRVLANCVGMRSNAMLAICDSAAQTDIEIVCDQRDAEFYADCPGIIALPTSYGRMRSALTNRHTVRSPLGSSA